MKPGHKLGPYEIIDQLGVGGMGQVYEALDTRLDRKVAIKVLHPEYADDAERLARFEQEARASASIGHANIATVYDIGQDDDVHYLVQEYLQGHTLRTVISDRALPPRRALALATEIAEALVAAHSSGIAHRDLKPENIFVTEDGHAKVLDFGLAKLLELKRAQLADDPDVSMTSTDEFTPVGTKVGQLLGSPGYMSPEQVDGRTIDHRTDIFSFGCVFYEMLSGQRAFSGRTVIETMHQIQHQEPRALLELQPGLQTELQWVLDKCLAKDVDERYQDTKDLVVRLRHVGQTLALTGVASTISIPGRQAERAVPRPAPETGLTTKITWAGVGLTVGRGGPRNSDRLLRWDPDQEEGVWNATEETELSC